VNGLKKNLSLPNSIRFSKIKALSLKYPDLTRFLRHFSNKASYDKENFSEKQYQKKFFYSNDFLFFANTKLSTLI
jgi:hypothetical protein